MVEEITVPEQLCWKAEVNEEGEVVMVCGECPPEGGILAPLGTELGTVKGTGIIVKNSE